jgi:hypothetical protein
MLAWGWRNVEDAKYGGCVISKSKTDNVWLMEQAKVRNNKLIKLTRSQVISRQRV